MAMHLIFCDDRVLRVHNLLPTYSAGHSKVQIDLFRSLPVIDSVYESILVATCGIATV